MLGNFGFRIYRKLEDFFLRTRNLRSSGLLMEFNSLDKSTDSQVICGNSDFLVTLVFDFSSYRDAPGTRRLSEWIDSHTGDSAVLSSLCTPSGLISSAIGVIGVIRESNSPSNRATV